VQVAQKLQIAFSPHNPYFPLTSSIQPEPNSSLFHMTSAEIRRSFLDFFRSKEHSIVPSSSLLPDSPNLLFTNAGMNQFVPIFLGATPCPYTPPRAADTQKCIRAGGKHNDLEDVGIDTYHHTFFEMLGSWSFGDYFKKEAIQWAWELLVVKWKFPAERLYATVYSPAEGDPASFDVEAHSLWSELFLSKGLDPAIHVVPGNRKDNFWMMGETGPCGPCSELHIDLTPYGDTKGALVNKGSAECIEIWNLVFIQFNANPDGSFVPLPACHVDTGMGFERVCSVMQGTRGFKEFGNVVISNYETDLFRPIFDAISSLCGRKYGSTLPQPSGDNALAPTNQQEKEDIAFRVIADHVRTLGFAIADGIQPGNTERHYVLRRILRRAVRYGRTLGFTAPFLYKLTLVLSSVMGDAFPEIRNRQELITETLRREEEAFHKTLDKGLALFENEAAKGMGISGEVAFRLYDEQGFPLDLTELLARERGLSVDQSGFEVLMGQQRERARAAQKKEMITLSSLETTIPTGFLGFEQLETEASVLEVVRIKDRTAVILDRSACYAEMGGQLGDTGSLVTGGALWLITDTQKSGPTWLHFVEGEDAPLPGASVTLTVDETRRSAIQRHHTVTHLLHWALRGVLGETVSQKGSFVGDDKITFDFSSGALTSDQLSSVERLVNEQILANATVSWLEIPFSEVKGRPGILQFFGDKYGDIVRVVQIGGMPGQFDGYSMELCGGTHVRATGEIGLFRIISEAAVAAGTRRIEAVAGHEARLTTERDAERLRSLASRLGAPLAEVEKKLEATLARQKDLENELDLLRRREAATLAGELLKKATSGDRPSIVAEVPGANGNALQSAVDALKGNFDGVIFLAGVSGGAGSLVGSTGKSHQAALPAGKLISAVAPLVGGKGGGKPDNARGGGKDPSGLAAALQKARELIAAGAI
jgi:alanyl-tRNA synthetase